MSNKGERAIEAAGKRLAHVQGAEPYSASPEAFQNDARETIRAYLDALPGWRLAPVEPTNAMVADGLEAESDLSCVEDIFECMMDACPIPPGLKNSDD